MKYLSGPCKTKAIAGGYKYVVSPVNDGTQVLDKVRIEASFAGGTGTVTVKKGTSTLFTGSLTGSVTKKGCNCDVEWDSGEAGSFGVTPTGLSGNAETPDFEV